MRRDQAPKPPKRSVVASAPKASAGVLPPGLRAWARPVLRWTARLGIASGLAYAVLLGVQESYEYATTSPRFEVRGLIYTPTMHVSDARLRELMALPPGTNILSLDLDAVAERIAEDPWVARATVVRELPDTLDVAVEEHEAAAVLLTDTFVLVNREGLPFKPLTEGERGQLPVITGPSRLDFLEHPRATRDRMRRAMGVLEAYAAKHRPRLSEVHVDPDGGLTLYTAERGSQLRLGRGDVHRALARYDALRAALGQDSDKLAVAHLDGSDTPEQQDRVVASFFEADPVPQFVIEVEEQTRAKALALEEAQAQAQERKAKKRQRRKGALPRYE